MNFCTIDHLAWLYIGRRTGGLGAGTREPPAELFRLDPLITMRCTADDLIFRHDITHTAMLIQTRVLRASAIGALKVTSTMLALGSATTIGTGNTYAMHTVAMHNSFLFHLAVIQKDIRHFYRVQLKFPERANPKPSIWPCTLPVIRLALSGNSQLLPRFCINWPSRAMAP